MTAPLLTALIFTASALHAADTYFPPPDSAGGWREAKTEKAMREQAGMDLSKLEPAYTITERSTAHGAWRSGGGAEGLAGV